MLALRVTDFEHAAGCSRNSACLSVGLVYREVQTRQKELAVLSLPQIAEIRNHGRGNGPQSPDNLSCVVKPAHMGVAGGEIPICKRVARILLDRAEEHRHRLIEATADKMRGAYSNERRANTGARAQAERYLHVFDRDVGLAGPIS